MSGLTPELTAWRDRIRAWARECGLEFFEVQFELLDYDELNEVAAFGGYPTRYPHWRFGMEYEHLAKGHAYGMSRIYELVINNDPCYAYLMRANPPVVQKLVMAHVYAHSDFFRNNRFFAHTNRRMIDEMANHGTRIRKHIDREGQEKVEDFIDACLSLENLIDVHASGIRRRRDKPQGPLEPQAAKAEVPLKMRSKGYMDRFINPPSFLRAQEREIRVEQDKRKRIPEEPERDVLLFLLEHAPLEAWQKDVLDLVRDEAYYFAPQRMTKIMNEGWATYWHSEIMTRKALTADEAVDYAEKHAGAMGVQPGRLNPYKLGVELFRDIEERWNTGRFGPEWEQCEDMTARTRWDRGTGLGRSKIFEVRRDYDDVTFVDEYLTDDFCRDHKLFTYRYNSRTGHYEIENRDATQIRRKLLFQLTNFGQPIVRVTDANHLNRGELYLVHETDKDAGEEQELQLDQARDTLENLFRLWTRPVRLETRVSGKRRILSYDGDEHSDEELRREV